jgi:hypothetical protein
MFSTHPPTGDRIEMSKKNIEQVLPDKDQYVVTTSEFNRVKMQLAQLENRKPSADEANKPSLKRRTQRRDPNADDTSSTNNKKDKDSQADSTKPDDRQPDDDDRPTLKRRE